MTNIFRVIGATLFGQKMQKNNTFKAEHAKRRESKLASLAAEIPIQRAVAKLPASVVRVRLRRSESQEPRPLATTLISGSDGVDFRAYDVDCDGMTFFAPAPDPEAIVESDKFLSRLLSKRAWPVDTIACLASLAHGRVMLDVGANIGLTSIPRAVLQHFETIHAFEPEQRNFACLSRAIITNNLNDRVIAWNTAVGSRDGLVGLVVSQGIARHTVAVSSTDKNVVPTRMTSIDSWLAETQVDPTTIGFVKVDTQGYESHVLAGASRLLAVPNVTWQMEFSPAHMKRADTSIEGFGEQLIRNFVAFLDLREFERGLRPIDQVGETLASRLSGYTDIVAISRGA